MIDMNKKSDVNAKLAYKAYLGKKGFSNVRIIASPADIIAEKQNKVYYFEIKMTQQNRNYFGAATITEWQQALKKPDTFKFVIAKTSDSGLNFEFIEFTPHDFLKYSTIPPFKVNFNIDLENIGKISNRKMSLQATEMNINDLISIYKSLQDNN